MGHHCHQLQAWKTSESPSLGQCLTKQDGKAYPVTTPVSAAAWCLDSCELSKQSTKSTSEATTDFWQELRQYARVFLTISRLVTAHSLLACPKEMRVDPTWLDSHKDCFNDICEAGVVGAGLQVKRQHHRLLMGHRRQ
eukprot:4110180-Amphidinium_carterae.1